MERTEPNYNLRTNSQRKYARDDRYTYDERCMNYDEFPDKTKKLSRSLRGRTIQTITPNDIESMAKLLVKFVNDVNHSWHIHEAKRKEPQPPKRQTRMSNRKNLIDQLKSTESTEMIPIEKTKKKSPIKAFINKKKTLIPSKQKIIEEEPMILDKI